MLYGLGGGVSRFRGSRLWEFKGSLSVKPKDLLLLGFMTDCRHVGWQV